MFFIVPPFPPIPNSATSTLATSALSSNSSTRDSSIQEFVASYYPKRTPKACDRCRLRKARCSLGRGACTKCKRDGVVCVSSPSTKPNPKIKNPAYVQMLEGQRDVLVQALHKIFMKTGDTSGASYDLNAVVEELNAHRNGASPDTSYDMSAILQRADTHRQLSSETEMQSAIDLNATRQPTSLLTTVESIPSISVPEHFYPPDISNVNMKPDNLMLDQSETVSMTNDQVNFEKYYSEWLFLTPDPIPNLEQVSDEQDVPSLSDQLTWNNWPEFCNQETPYPFRAGQSNVT